MRGEILADILLILLTGSVIYAILFLVHRGNKKSSKKDDASNMKSTEEDSEK